MTKVYVAGPMTGIPQFNFPAFDAAAAALRAAGYEVVSPHERDSPAVQAAARASADGKLDNGKVANETWGDMLARDVKLLADEGIQGIVFLPGWARSRGALLEALTGILCSLKFFAFEHGEVIPLPALLVAEQIHGGLRARVQA